jgi:alginate O-acetyltransferase complex protein AlgI
VLFSEPAFLFLFLPLTLASYFAAPRRGRNLVLVVASIVYYVWGEVHFLPYLAGSIALNYWFAIEIERHRGQPVARRWLIAGLCVDLGLLLVFKYLGFFGDNFNAMLAWAHQTPLALRRIALPLGISFFTFHKISYKVDVYRGDAEAKKSVLDLTLYILLFPQLIAGPIVRYHEIAHQLSVRDERVEDFAFGVQRFIVGLAKKMLVANSVAMTADRIFSLPPDQCSAAVAWLGALAYSIQLYFDFSGYSDMAVGLARMFGFTFPENFNYPYIARSITEFWRRWHMTLSRWFKDYLYIPLGGNRVSSLRLYGNLVTVFFLCGLWHGASWNFVVWGLYHGLFQVLERLGLGGRLRTLPAPLQHFYALLVVVVGWVFFRAPSLTHAVQFLGTMFGYPHGVVPFTHPGAFVDRLACLALAAGALGATPLPTAAWRWLARRAETVGEGFRHGLRAAALGGLFALCMLFVAADTYNPFIYFRF